jgi:predicted alpha/beta-hydrolase family hydrolase
MLAPGLRPPPLPPESAVPTSAQALRFQVDADNSVSAVLDNSDAPIACYVLAHGAGAGMTHPFMASAALGLAARGIACLRYQFPYMESGGKRVDPPALAHATVRAAVACAAQHLPGLPLVAGGKSFGGRMTSQAQAAAPLPGVGGLVFIGFPLHPEGKPSVTRAEHLAHVSLPMLFLQGTRDGLADEALIREVTDGLGERATLRLVDDADHSFHVRARSGRNDVQVLEALLDEIAAWVAAR